MDQLLLEEREYEDSRNTSDCSCTGRVQHCAVPASAIQSHSVP